LQLNKLHGVTSQKIIRFITTAVKTSNPIYVRNSLEKSYTSKYNKEIVVVGSEEV
jgi:hypothetical protein